MNFSLTIPTSTVSVLPPSVEGVRRPLLTPLPTPGEFLLVIDNSSLEKFVTCPVAAQNYLVHGREAHARNAALTFGGAIHVGMEKLELGEPISVQDQAVVDFFAAHPTPLDEYRTVQNALEVMKHYRVRRSWPDYEWTVQRDAKGPLVERAFELPLGVLDINSWLDMPWLTEEQWKTEICKQANGYPYKGTEVMQQPVPVSRIHVAWSGRIDLIAHCNSRVRVIDHKTTSIAGDQVVQDFHLSNQTIGYVWAARQLYPNLAVSGFCVNFIHLKKPTKGVGLADRGPRGGDPALNFFRAFFDYSDDRLSWWHDNVLTVVSDFVSCLVRNHFPAHTKWCFGKYGKCPYHDSCVQDDPQVRHNILMSDMYKQVTWNPTADR